MITGTLTLAFCTVALRRFVDRVTGRIPILPVSNSFTNNQIAVVLFTGAMYYLYSHLRRGTLVSIGQGHKGTNSALKSNIQKRSKNNSWFLKNAWGKRKNCTEAICRLAKHSVESLHNLIPCVLLPNKDFQISFVKPPANSDGEGYRSVSVDTSLDNINCDLIYSRKAIAESSKDPLKSSLNLNLDEIGFLDRTPIHKGLLKRLDRKKVGGKHCSKNSNKDISRVTRSGRIYNPNT